MTLSGKRDRLWREHLVSSVEVPNGHQLEKDQLHRSDDGGNRGERARGHANRYLIRPC